MNKFKPGDKVVLTGPEWDIYRGETRTVIAVGFSEFYEKTTVQFSEGHGFHWVISSGWEIALVEDARAETVSELGEYLESQGLSVSTGILGRVIYIVERRA